MKAPIPQRLKILIAEDDPNDRKLLAAAAQGEDFGEWFVVDDGQELIEYLRGTGKFGDRRLHPFPDLVVLDLMMPLMTGMEVLEWIRKESDWPQLPVLLLSGSGMERDVEEAYRLGANGYFQKPYSNVDLKAVLRVIVDYWVFCEKPKRKKDDGVISG